VLECEPSIDALNERNLIADNKAPMIEKLSPWDDEEPIIGSGLAYPTDQERDNNVMLKRAKKMADVKCTKERVK
jgi:hypothetical protein